MLKKIYIIDKHIISTMITTIIFDLAEVYLKGIKGIEYYLEPILNKKAKDIYLSLKGKKFIDLMHGKITEEEYWSKVIKENNWKINISSLKKAIRNNFNEIEGTRDIIEKLKEKGFKLGLLSVHSKEWIDYCEKKFNFHKLFHSILYSFEIEICKPDERAYKFILKRLKVKPEECLFVDDSPKNIEVAKKLRINTILFKNSNQLKEELSHFLIYLN